MLFHVKNYVLCLAENLTNLPTRAKISKFDFGKFLYLKVYFGINFSFNFAVITHLYNFHDNLSKCI